MPSRSMLRPSSSEEDSEDHIQDKRKENNNTSNTISATRNGPRRQARLRRPKVLDTFSGL